MEEVARHISGGGDGALLDEVLQVVGKYILPLPSLLKMECFRTAV